MSNQYQPEFGQMLFGQPHKEYEVPTLVRAALEHIDYEMERAWGNTHPHTDRYSSPFGNTGAVYETPTFSVQAYSWGDEDQPWNFKWRDLEISWYKYLGRGMSANKEITPDLCAEMLNDCLKAVRALEHNDEQQSSLG